MLRLNFSAQSKENNQRYLPTSSRRRPGSVDGLRGHRQHCAEAGIKANQGIGMTEQLMDARSLFLKPNTTTVYAFFCLNLRKDRSWFVFRRAYWDRSTMPTFVG